MSNMDLDRWTLASRRSDGTDHQFDIAFKNHPRKGHIGLPDHGGNLWYKNLERKRLNSGT